MQYVILRAKVPSDASVPPWFLMEHLKAVAETFGAEVEVAQVRDADEESIEKEGL